MKLPLEVVTRGHAPPAGMMEVVRDHAARLDHFCDRIMRARVTIEGRTRHPGPPRWALRLALTVPGGTIVVNRQKGENLPEALREAFDAATRRLEDHVRRRRGLVKAAARPSRGKVVELFPERGYGFLRDDAGRELYFHANSVRPPGFERLGVGSRVRFAEEAGDQGPQASSVSFGRARKEAP